MNKKLIEYRKSRGMSQEILGIYLGYTRQTIAAYESGDKPMPQLLVRFLEESKREYSLNDMLANIRTHIPDFEMASRIVKLVEIAEAMEQARGE